MAIGTPADLGHTQVNGTNTSLAITTTANILSGDLIVVISTGGSNSVNMSACTDSGGVNVYTVIAASATAPTSNVAYCANATALASGGSITATFPSTSARKGISAFRVSGMKTSSPLDSTTANPQTQTAGSGATSAAACVTGILGAQPALLVGSLATSATDPGTITLAGWTAIGGTTATAFIKPFYKVVSTVASDSTFAPSWVNAAGFRTLLKIFDAAGASSSGGAAAMMMLGVG